MEGVEQRWKNIAGDFSLSLRNQMVSNDSFGALRVTVVA